MTKSTITRDKLRALAVKKVESLKFAITQSAFTNIRRGLEEELQLAEFALAAMDSEPVAWTWRYREQWHVTNDKCRAEFVATDGDVAVLPLYRHAQPAPEKYNIGDATMRHIFTPTGMTNVSDMQAVFDRVEAVLVGMDQPAPVVPDGYVMVPMRLTAENGAKGALSGEFSETKFVNCPECFGDDECETCDGSGRIEITVPVTWTTIKEIWAKGVEHFAAAPQSPGGDHATVPGKWIPVSEQMPPSRHEVLVGRWWGEKPRWCCKWATYIPGHPDAQSSGWLIPGASWTPTHWMPLPAAPQEVK
ncbi:DUF551 domain-containing protein [Klebsiella pneumoniae]|uniref:DUF551 domain-containing protein n=1 Tax=Klebsiella pneumoniae TaxID=573 RepID=UPI003970FE50